MPDDPKKPVPYATIRGEEKRLPATTQAEKAPAWAISMQEAITAKQDANHRLVLAKFSDIEARVGSLEATRATGPQVPFAGPQTTTSGEVRRISQSDIAQNKAITGLSENQVALSDKVDAIDRKMTAADRRLDDQDREIAAVKSAATIAKDNTVDIKKSVGGFFRQHPELTTSIATLLGVLIALATAWLQSKVHQ